MPRGGRHHHAPHASVSGVEDVVEALLEQRAGLVDAALDQRDRVRIQVLGDDLRERAEVLIVSSEGFSTAQLPAAIAPTSGVSRRATG